MQPKDKVSKKDKGKVTFQESTFDRITNKKKEYLQEEIYDKNGQFSYLEDPVEYKKARK